MLFLTPDEVRALADAIPTPAYRLAVYVAAYCGLRAGALWGLRRCDIDPLRKTLTVAQALKEVYSSALAKAGHDPDELGLFVGEPKSAAAHRTITMPAFVAAMMAERLAVPSPGGNGPTDFVFTVPTGEPVAHSNFYERVFSPVVRAARRSPPVAFVPATRHASSRRKRPSCRRCRRGSAACAFTTCGIPARACRSRPSRACTS